MSVFKCEKCGGTLEINESQSVAVCKNCGLQQTLPNPADKKQPKRKKRIAIITIPIVCLVIAFVIILNTVIIPELKYKSVINLLESGNAVEAYETLTSLDRYKDSAERAGDVYVQYKSEIMKSVKVGSSIFFGSYEQDNDTSNGTEAVEWLVLEVKDDKALVISKYALDCMQYNDDYADVTWESCTLRTWLNNDFLNSAFSEEERAMIPTVTVSAEVNPDYSTNPGNATQDKIFLLSANEVNEYFASENSRKCEPTDYAFSKGAYRFSFTGKCWWWLRSTGYFQNRGASVDVTGYLNEYGIHVSYDIGAVRPALWIELNS